MLCSVMLCYVMLCMHRSWQGMNESRYTRTELAIQLLHDVMLALARYHNHMDPHAPRPTSHSSHAPRPNSLAPPPMSHAPPLTPHLPHTTPHAPRLARLTASPLSSSSPLVLVGEAPPICCSAAAPVCAWVGRYSKRYTGESFNTQGTKQAPEKRTV
jgi:hypothetical protein